MSKAIAASNTSYPLVSLKEFAQPISRPIDVVPGSSYRTMGVKWWGEGAYERETIDGSRTAAKTLFMIRSGDLVINKIWVRHGSTAVANGDVDGCAASGEFPTFELDKDKVVPHWLHWLTKTEQFWNQCANLSQGTSGKNRIKPELFLTIDIPLPPIAEQRRIVARVEELAGKVEEARGLRSQALKEAERLPERASSDILDSDKWELKRLETVLTESPRNGLSPQREVESHGKPMLRINAVSSSPTRYVDISAHKLVDVSDDVAHPFTLQDGDVFIVRYNGDINRLAKAAIFKTDDESDVVYPDKLMRLRADPNIILPDFLVYALGSRRVRAQVEELGITTAGQLGISGKNAKSFLISVPPLSEQRRIITYLDDLQAKVDALKQLQAETEAELNALLPSILHKAFKGEL